MPPRPKLTKLEYHQLATAGARALLVEMEAKKLAVLDSFPELHAAMEGLPKLKGRKGQRQIASRAEAAARAAWALTQKRLTVGEVVERFGVTQGAASQMLIKLAKKKQLRRVAPGVYSAQKALKAA